MQAAAFHCQQGHTHTYNWALSNRVHLQPPTVLVVIRVEVVARLLVHAGVTAHTSCRHSCNKRAMPRASKPFAPLMLAHKCLACCLNTYTHARTHTHTQATHQRVGAAPGDPGPCCSCCCCWPSGRGGREEALAPMLPAVVSCNAGGPCTLCGGCVPKGTMPGGGPAGPRGTKFGGTEGWGGAA